MKKSHALGMCSATVLLTCAGLASAVMAQSAPVKPQYYSFELCPSPNDGYEHEDRFMSAVRVRLNPQFVNPVRPATSPLSAAQLTVSLLQDRIAEQTIDAQHALLCITLQNFGGKGPKEYRHAPFSFLRYEDRVTIDPAGFPSNRDIETFELLQPWMTTAVGVWNPATQTWEGGAATAWMWSYLHDLENELADASLLPQPIPRFHGEIETSLTNGDYGNAIIRVMVACEQDPRWATVPVPGFGGQTMLEIWQDAQDVYGWRDPITGQYRTLNALLIPSQDASSSNNKPYFSWWTSVVGRARDAVVKITCYDVIKGHFLTSGSKVSNYGHANMDMGLDTFAYRDLTNDGVDNPVNVWRRGGYDLGGFGAFPSFLTSSEPPLAFGMWPGFASGDFDSPDLYYRPYWSGSPPVVSPNVDKLRQRRWYEPPETATGLRPMETWPQFFRRTHRHTLDSIIHTPSRAPAGVVPWVALPNLEPLDPIGGVAGIDETRRTLALIRSKDIREVIMFGDKRPNGRGDVQDWVEFKRADAQVYTPYLKSAELLRGVGGPWSESALNTTLRTTNPAELVIESEYAGSPSHHHVTEFVTRFHGVRPQSLGNNGRIVLECRVAPNNPAEVAPGWRGQIRGQVSIWNETLEQWDPVATIQDVPQLYGEYRFHVDDPGALGSTSTRREWDLGCPGWNGLCEYLSDRELCEDGSITIKFTHLALELPSGFSSKYDLVMFYHLDDAPAALAASPSENDGQGSITTSMSNSEAPAIGFLAADFNFDGVQDATDATLFTSAWTNGERRADYNADGEIDIDDLTQFLAALARALQSTGTGTNEE